MHQHKQLYKIFMAGKRIFPVYLEYDRQLNEFYPAFPDFEKHPEYTDEGRPFATAEQECCPHSKAGAPGETPPDDCGDCAWFFREFTPYDPIGVCMCSERRKKTEIDRGR